MRRQEGVVQLRFVVDRTGKVLSYQIAESSGHRLLDEEVERMIARAQPLPAIPADMNQDRLELVLPVSFNLR
jgi:protein TonB